MCLILNKKELSEKIWLKGEIDITVFIIHAVSLR
jgi:hypothetical protein